MVLSKSSVPFIESLSFVQKVVLIPTSCGCFLLHNRPKNEVVLTILHLANASTSLVVIIVCAVVVQSKHFTRGIKTFPNLVPTKIFSVVSVFVLILNFAHMKVFLIGINSISVRKMFGAPYGHHI